MSCQSRSFRYASLLVIALGIGACTASSKKYNAASSDLADQLVEQVQKRSDPRLIRVLVYEFTPCASPSTATYAPHKEKAHAENEFARQVKHQVITALARRMVVLEGDALEHTSNGRNSARTGSAQDAPEFDPYPEARLLDANAVVVGNYFVEGDDNVLIMARLVDTRTNEILATGEETIENVLVPHAHK